HFAYIAAAIHDRGLWDEQDGFYYDVLQIGSGERVPLRVRSMVGVLPLAATTTLGQQTLRDLPWFAEHVQWFLDHKPAFAMNAERGPGGEGGTGRLLAIASPDRLDRVLRYVLDESELLSPHGVGALSARHRDEPFVVDLGGMRFGVDYEPGE